MSKVKVKFCCQVKTVFMHSDQLKKRSVERMDERMECRRGRKEEKGEKEDETTLWQLLHSRNDKSFIVQQNYRAQKQEKCALLLFESVEE